MNSGGFDRKKLEEYAQGAAGALKDAVDKARAKAGQVTHDNREKIDSAIEKAVDVVNEKTGGKYSDTVDKVKARAVQGVDFVERERPDDDTPEQSS